MNKLFSTGLLLLFSVFFLIQPVNGSSIDRSLGRLVAENFLTHLGQTASNHQIDSVEILTSPPDLQPIGFLVHLSPKGYILIPADTIRVPVKAYSLQTVFSSLPAAYTEILLNELTVPDIAMRSSIVPETTNSPFWDFLTTTAPILRANAYLPDTFLLTTQWNQRYPYNMLHPTQNGQQTLTGCTQTAVAQVMNYHQHPLNGSGVFSHDWNGQTLTSSMNRPFNWDIMVDRPHATTNLWEHQEVAALMLDLGILNDATFGDESTSAAFRRYDFEKAFGYAPIDYMTNDDPDFFETITGEIDNLRPVLLSIPGHMTVADGYASDSSGKKIHVNMGWGGAWDDYYFLDETINAGGYSFPPIHRIFYNIQPCSGEDCQPPYPPWGNNLPPEFSWTPEDVSVNGTRQIRLDIRDPDGDSVEISAFSTCSSEQFELNGNMLSLYPTAEETLCQYTVFGESHDGTVAETFSAIAGPEDSYRGKLFDTTGQFADNLEIYQYEVFLSGVTSISGDRGYSNQAFFIWVMDQAGVIITQPSDTTINATFEPGYYTITASLNNQAGSYYYYNADFSNFVLSVSLETSFDSLAADLGLSLVECQLTVETDGNGGGIITSQPTSLDCGTNCSVSLPCDSTLRLSPQPDEESVFTNWSGDCVGTDGAIIHHLTTDSTCRATFSKDIDQDDMPDDWELQYGLNTSLDDAHADNDQDGIDNITEYRNGTPPITLPGDTNGNDTVSLEDAILALKTVIGESPSEIKLESDVNGDGLIGIVEALYSLGREADYSPE